MSIQKRHFVWGLTLLSVVATAFYAQARQAKKQATITSAYSQVYDSYNKGCKDVDENTVSEGEDVPQLCKGFGDYWLYRTSAVYRVSLAVQSTRRDFTAPLAAEENEDAKRLEADCVKKFGDKVEWRLANGKPFAFIIRVSYYKDTSDAGTVFAPKNKAGEFLFVRGLRGYESLKYEVAVSNTPYNPNEQARALADRFFEERQRHE